MFHKKDSQIFIANCFRQEHGKLISILVGLFGTQHLTLAEDIVQDTFLEAIKNWSYKGVPDNPSGWLYKVAKNKIVNALKREKYRHDLSRNISLEEIQELKAGEFFNEKAINDEQLKMMFICCHPTLSPEAQSCFILKTLCGFSIDEIVRAFLSKKETITKRLLRTRKVIRASGLAFELPGKQELENRLDAVLKTIYLLYNEGYNASKGKLLIRKELCEEAIRLANFLCINEITNTSKTHALLALMYFNFSRFDARTDQNGEIIPLENQNRGQWNAESIALGFYHLSKVTADKKLSTYHIEATIAACHASAESHASTDWAQIMSLYDYLHQISPSPVVLLNQAVAMSYAKTIPEALQLLEDKTVKDQLQSYYLYYATKADLFIRLKEFKEAQRLLDKALNLTQIDAERSLLIRRLNDCSSHIQ